MLGEENAAHLEARDNRHSNPLEFGPWLGYGSAYSGADAYNRFICSDISVWSVPTHASKFEMGSDELFPEYYKSQRLVQRSVLWRSRCVLCYLHSAGCGAPLGRLKNRAGRPRINWAISCCTHTWHSVLGRMGRHSVGRTDIAVICHACCTRTRLLMHHVVLGLELVARPRSAALCALGPWAG